MERTTARTENAAAHYNAFISYSHAKTDSIIARKLHRKLEHYRIPSRLHHGAEKKLRVFRDKEELALSSDLTATIYEALRNSDFLIVLCSGASQNSKWVHREIEYFIQWHDIDHVLILLLDGEPEERFSEIWNEALNEGADHTETEAKSTHMEPFAADIRGKNIRNSAAKLNREFLRILAPILRCSYDSLRQRNREYQMKKAIAAMGAVLCLVLAFAGYAVYKNGQINEQYQLSQQNLARYLCSEALTLLNQGDRKAALIQTLTVLPENGSDDPVVPEQMYVLNETLHSYQRNDNYRYSPDFTVELDDNIVSMTTYSDTGRYLFCLSEKGRAYFLDLNEARLIWSVSPDDFDGIEDTDFLNGAFASEDRIVLMTEHAFLVLNLSTQSCEQIITDEIYINEEDTVFAVSENYLAAGYYGSGCIYTLSDGSLYCKYDIVESSWQDATCLAFSPDEKHLAIGMRTYSFSSYTGYDTEEEEESCNLFLFDLGSQELTKLDTGCALTAGFINNSVLGVVQFDPTSKSAISSIYYEYDYYAALYDVDSASQIWESGKNILQPVIKWILLLSDISIPSQSWRTLPPSPMGTRPLLCPSQYRIHGLSCNMAPGKYSTRWTLRIR